MNVDDERYIEILEFNRDILAETLSEIKAVSDNFGDEINLFEGGTVKADNERIQEILNHCLDQLKQINDQPDES